MSAGNWWSFCIGLNVFSDLILNSLDSPIVSIADDLSDIYFWVFM